MSQSCDSKNCECSNSTSKNIKFKSGIFSGSVFNNNVPIAFITAGKKKNQPVLLFHGNGGTKEGWIGIMRILAQNNYYAIAVDRRGTGESGKPATSNADYNISLIVLDHQLVLQYLGVSHPYVVGHSFGGRFAEQYYHQFVSDSIYSATKLVLLSPAVVGFPAGPGGVAFASAVTAGNLNAIASAYRDYAVNVICDKCSKSNKKLEALKQNVFNGALQTTVFAYQAIRNNGTATGSPPFQGNFIPAGTILPSIPVNVTTANVPNYSQITIPTLVMGGSEDLFVLPGALGLAEALIPGAFINEVRGAPHFLLLTNVSVVAEEFIKFFENIPAECDFNLETTIPKNSKC
jgi:pimeloyl-ACP methyl ester carboxylesterase